MFWPIRSSENLANGSPQVWTWFRSFSISPLLPVSNTCLEGHPCLRVLTYQFAMFQLLAWFLFGHYFVGQGHKSVFHMRPSCSSFRPQPPTRRLLHISQVQGAHLRGAGGPGRDHPHLEPGQVRRRRPGAGSADPRLLHGPFDKSRSGEVDLFLSTGGLGGEVVFLLF